MIYAEASYFEGYHFAHIVTWETVQRDAENRRRLRRKVRRQHLERFQ